MMPYLSIVVPTMRVGGLDVLLHGLTQQTCKDFELILVDGIHKYRKSYFEENKFDFNIKHVIPINNPFPLNSFCRYANTGLAHVSGEVVLFVTDYTWLQPDGVKIHTEFHRSHGPDIGFMGPHQYVSTPPMNEHFPGYDRDQIDQYVADIESGKLDSCMISSFAEPLATNADTLPLDPVYSNADPKIGYHYGDIYAAMFHGKNESCKINAVLDVNGWDEDLDGAHCYQDTDLAERLDIRAGVKWIVDPKNVAWIVNPRHVFPFPRRPRSVESNSKIWQSKKAKGFVDPVNRWSLREARKIALSLPSSS